tara:strand:+ start:864 stop:989 length:126 start_codon:yes stop_codon:yes gene_type:complete
MFDSSCILALGVVVIYLRGIPGITNARSTNIVGAVVDGWVS